MQLDEFSIIFHRKQNYSGYTTSMYDNSHYDHYFRLQNHTEMNMSEVVKWCYYEDFKRMYGDGK